MSEDPMLGWEAGDGILGLNMSKDAEKRKARAWQDIIIHYFKDSTKSGRSGKINLEKWSGDQPEAATKGE